MNNFVIFGTTQCGKSTLAGCIASCYLNDDEFNRAIKMSEKTIDKLGFGPLKKEMIYPSFVTLDRDELLRCSSTLEEEISAKGNPIGSTKKNQRKQVLLANADRTRSEILTMIDTPGNRYEAKERYAGIFEGDIGICVLNIRDIMNYDICTRYEVDEQAKRKLERKLFDPIRFWCTYKGENSLILVISKVDIKEIDFNQEIINAYSGMVAQKLASYGIGGVPVIPTSILISINSDGRVIRKTHNITASSELCPPREGKALIPTLFYLCDSLHISEKQEDELFASVSKICKIKNSKRHALRLKILSGNLEKSSQIIIGPVRKISDGTLQYITGQIKSLKEESSQTESTCLKCGTIGGVSFSFVYDTKYTTLPPASKRHELTEYKMLKTTVIASKALIRGNAVSLFVSDNEMGFGAQKAIKELRPKETIPFYWFGNRIAAHVIELYHTDNTWHITLCPIIRDDEFALGEFAVLQKPDGQLEQIECPIALKLPNRFVRKRDGKYLYTYTKFTLQKIDNFKDGEKYVFILTLTEDDFANYADNFSCDLKRILLDESKSEISLCDVTRDNCGNILRQIRYFLRDNEIVQYGLYWKRK